MSHTYTPPTINQKKFTSKLLMTLALLTMGLMGYGQFVPNTYTPITSANGLNPSLSASDITCGILNGCVSNLGNIVGPLENAATINSIVLTTDWIQVDFNQTAPAGSYAGFVIESGVELVSNLQVTVSHGNTSETISGPGLLSLGLSGSTKIGFYPSIDFNSIRITYGGLLGSLDVYYAEAMVFQAADPLTCNVPTVMTRPEFPLTVTSSVTDGGTVTNPENAVDENTTNSASLGVLLAGSASLSVKDEVSSYPANTYVGFDIENTSLLSLELLDDITITTYLNDAVAETYSGADQLVSLGLLGSTTSRVGFLTTQEFNEVEITISSGGLNLGTTLVYNAIIQCFTPGPGLTDCNEPNVLTAPEYPLYISERTGISDVLDSNGEIVDAANVIDANTGNFAQLNYLASVGSEISLGVKDAITDYPAGTFVGFDIENSASILNLDLLSTITISSYLDGNLQESVSGSSLLLGADLLSGANRRTLGFVTSTQVDEVVITLDGGLLGVSLGSTNVYGAIFQCFTAGPGLATCNTYTRPTTPDYPLTISQVDISGAACVDCDIYNTTNIIDSDPNTFAEINFTAAVAATMSIGVKDQVTNYGAGTFAGFDIENTASLLDLQLLNSITITTYQDGTLQETSSGQNLVIGASLITGSDRQTVGFVTSMPFDEVVLSLEGDLADASLGTTRVYNLVLKCFAEGPALTCNTNTYMTESKYPYSINITNTGVDGLLGVNNQITELSNLLDDNTDNFASVTQTASSGTATIAIQKSLSPLSAGTYVAFDLDNPNLLGAELFKGLTVATYLNGALVESVSSDDLISVSTSILSGTGRQKVGFIAGGAFDEVRLSVNASLIGLNLGTTQVYGLILQEFCEGPELTCNEHSLLYGGPSGHPVIVNGQRTGVDGTVCAGCQITDPENAIDNAPNTSATISLVGGVGASADFSVLNALDTYQAGTYAGFDIGSPDLVGADVIGDFTITTYLDGVQQEQVDIPSAVIAASSSLVNDGREVIGFVTSEDFDEIQLSMSSLISADVGVINIYSTIVQTACPGAIDCTQAYQWLSPDFPLVVEGPHTGIDGIAGLLSEVIDPWNLINQNTSDFAVLVAPVGVANPASISIKDQESEYPTGTTVGFTVRSENNILQVTLLESISITTYLNGVEVESVSGSNLLNLDALVPLLGTGGTPYNVGFVTSAPFDEVQISLNALVDALNILHVYSPFVDRRTAVDGNGNALCPQTNINPDFNVTFINIPVNGKVNTNDEVPTGTLYGTPIADGGNPGGGSLNMNADGSYTFEANTPGTYHYQVPVCVPDQPAPCPTTRLSITVLNQTDPTTNPPVANTDYATVISNSNATVPTLVNDAPGFADAELNPGSVTINSGPHHGNATVDLNTGNITYIPDPGFVGKDSLMYQVCDDSDPTLCSTAWQIFSVTPDGSPNTTIAADDYAFTIGDSETVTGNVATNDSDPEGHSQTVTTQDRTIPGVGSFTLTSDGSFEFTPEDGFSGPAEINYQTCDSEGSCATATLHILVQQEGPNYQPTISLNRTAITAPNADISFTIRVFEKNNISAFPGSNLISVRVNKDSRIAITWDPNLMGQFGSNPFNQVDNSLWVFDDSHPAFYSWTYVGSSGGSSVFPASGSYRLGVHAQYIDPAETSGTTSISVFIPFNNVGGEVNFEDNQDTEILSIQTITE